MRAGVAPQRCRGLLGAQWARFGGDRAAAAQVDADVGLGLDIAVPLRPLAEARDDDVGARLGGIDDLEDDVAAGAALAADVLEHQQPPAEDRPQPRSVEPDRRPDEPAHPQQAGAGPGEAFTQAGLTQHWFAKPAHASFDMPLSKTTDVTLNTQARCHRRAIMCEAGTAAVSRSTAHRPLAFPPAD